MEFLVGSSIIAQYFVTCLSGRLVLALLSCCCPLPRISSSLIPHKIGALTYPNVATTVSSSKHGPVYFLFLGTCNTGTG
ncbi:hypothetical protein F4805DRAFT_139745 [Annulohypoxylon moriforme]|nr:hypothetical protein F4805DRAFT_139745 [Annulohypoxylon moriforme]